MKWTSRVVMDTKSDAGAVVLDDEADVPEAAEYLHAVEN